jgi:putative hydrolase of the HAD superfamily
MRERELSGRSVSRGAAPVRAVTFDVGNTLFPFREREMNALLGGFVDFIRDRVGPCDPAEVVARYNAIRKEQYRVNLPHLRENDLVDRVRLTLETVTPVVAPELLAEAMEAYIELLPRSLPLPEKVPALLERLGARYRLGVITNYPYSPGSRHLLEVTGLTRFFSCVIISADWEFVKPHPVLFRRAALELDVEPENVVHVGDDWEADIIGATRSGLRSVYFTGLREEPDGRRDDPEGRPLAIIHGLEQLPEVLEASARQAGSR